MSRPAKRPRVVLDCNVVIQAIANGDGPAGQVLRLMQESRIEVCVSRATMKELRAVLRYPTVRRKLPGMADDRIDLFLKNLLYRAMLFRQVPHVFDYPRATQDEPYIDLAIAAEADYLISRDRDLLSLPADRTPLGKQLRQQCPGLGVIDPPSFLAIMAPRKP